jgi:hypothetical protein
MNKEIMEEKEEKTEKTKRRSYFEDFERGLLKGAAIFGFIQWVGRN